MSISPAGALSSTMGGQAGASGTTNLCFMSPNQRAEKLLEMSVKGPEERMMLQLLEMTYPNMSSVQLYAKLKEMMATGGQPGSQKDNDSRPPGQARGQLLNMVA